MIYYLIRPPDIAAVVTEARAADMESQGYERVEAWRFVYWWSLRDYLAYVRLRGVVASQARAVGDAMDLYPPPRLFWQRRRS